MDLLTKIRNSLGTIGNTLGNDIKGAETGIQNFAKPLISPLVKQSAPVVNNVVNDIGNFRPLSLTPANSFLNSIHFNPTIKQFGLNAFNSLNNTGIQQNKAMQYFANPTKYAANKSIADNFIGNVIGSIGGGEERNTKQVLDNAYKLFADQLKASPLINDVTKHLDPQEIKGYVKTFAKMTPHPNRDVFSNNAIKLANFITATEKGVFANKPQVGLGLNIANRVKQDTQDVASNLADTSKQIPDYLNTQGKNFTQALRTFYVGTRDSQIAEANQLANNIASVVKNPIDQQALTLYREFKNKPGELKKFLNGTSSVYDDLVSRYKEANPNATPEELAKIRQQAVSRVQQLTPIIQRAISPTRDMINADKTLTQYFSQKLQQGKDAGFLDSKVNPDEYINRILLNEQEGARPLTNVGGGKMTKNFNFGKKRSYPTILDAVVNGRTPATFNALDALRLYGDRHSTVAATHTLFNTLHDNGLAKWYGSDQQAMQAGKNGEAPWVQVGAGNKLFQKVFAFTDKNGNPAPGFLHMYANPKVAEAINPIVAPNGIAKFAKGLQKTKVISSYYKAVELGLSPFHMRALTLTGINNMGYLNAIKGTAKAGVNALNLSDKGNIFSALESKMNSSEFQDIEKEFIQHGGQTSILGKTIEAYKGLKTSPLTKQDENILSFMANKAKGTIPIKALSAIGEKISHTTFDVMQRYYKVADYSLQKAGWIAKHPDATPNEVSQAMRDIATQVNATYGGLNWETMGVSQTMRGVMQLLFLAPDWTFSNLMNVKQAIVPNAARGKAIGFWLRSFATGIAASQLASVMLSGQLSPDPTQVYMGKDANGKDVMTNIFFAGAPSDMINLVHNWMDYGAVQGTGQFIANKQAFFPRMVSRAMTNTQYQGVPIVPKGLNPVASTIRAGAYFGSSFLPLPFSITNPIGMAFDQKNPHLPSEYLTTALTGASTRHVVPQGMRQVNSGALKGKLVPQTASTPNDILTQTLTGKANKSSRVSLQQPNELQQIWDKFFGQAHAASKGDTTTANQNAVKLIKAWIKNPSSTSEDQLKQQLGGVNYTNAYISSVVSGTNLPRKNGLLDLSPINFKDFSVNGEKNKVAKLTLAMDIYKTDNSKLPQSMKDQAYQQLGLKNPAIDKAIKQSGIGTDQVDYMVRASANYKDKVPALEDVANSMSHTDFINYLTERRAVALNGKQFTDTSTLTQLTDDGYISKAEEKALKTVFFSFDKNGNPVPTARMQTALGSGRAASGKAAAKALLKEEENVVKAAEKNKLASLKAASKVPKFKALPKLKLANNLNPNAVTRAAFTQNTVRPLSTAQILALTRIKAQPRLQRIKL